MGTVNQTQSAQKNVCSQPLSCLSRPLTLVCIWASNDSGIANLHTLLATLWNSRLQPCLLKLPASSWNRLSFYCWITLHAPDNKHLWVVWFSRSFPAYWLFHLMVNPPEVRKSSEPFASCCSCFWYGAFNNPARSHRAHEDLAVVVCALHGFGS